MQSGAEAGPQGQRFWHARVWALAGPIIFSNLSTPLLGAVDTAVVGHLPDPVYIGAVAVGAVVFSFLFWGFGFLRMGTTGFTAQAHGAGAFDEWRATLGRALLLALLLGALLILLQVPVGWLAFQLFDASPGVEALAYDYYAIRIWGAPATLINYVLLGWLLGTGRAGSVMVLQIALNGINIVLDLLFVLGFGWAVEGVAIASVLAEIAAALLGVLIVARVLRRTGGHWDRTLLLHSRRIVALLRVNFDILIRTLCLVAAFAVFTAESAKFGDTLLAANAILLQLMNMTAYGLDGFAHAAEVLTGKALGARNRASFRSAVTISTIWAGLLALAISLLYWGLGDVLIGLFTDIASVRSAAAPYLPWIILAPIVSVWSFQLDGIFIGATRTGAMRNAMVLSLVFFLLGCWLLVPLYGNHGLWLTLLAFMILRAITLGAYYPSLERSVEQGPVAAAR